MGGALSAWFPRFFGGREVRVLILGLDNAGKTTLLYRLHLNEVIQTIPTIGFNVETVKYKNIEFQVWDLGGQSSIRPYWRCYYPNTQALIYVVDSSDVDRISDARQELLLMIEEEELKDVALAVVANKQDLPKALNEGEISLALGLPFLKDRPWSLFPASAVRGDGLEEVLEWLAEVLS